MTRRIPIGRIVAAVVGIFVLYILFQAYSQHWHVGAVIPAVISLFLFLLYLVHKFIGALLRMLAWPFGLPILVVLCCSPPYSGANVRPVTGLIRESVFVEEIRKHIHRQQVTLPAEHAVATADRASNDGRKVAAPYDGDFKITP